MTQQATDSIQFNGLVRPLQELPLASHSGLPALSDRLVIMSTDNWRGYTARWTIRDDFLFLIQINGFIKGGGDVELSDLVPGQLEPLLADWYSGELTMADGRRIGSESDYGPDIYERAIVMHCTEGRCRTINILNHDPAEVGLLWPRRSWYPMTEQGHNDFANAWVQARRKTPVLSNIPMDAIEDFRSATAMAKSNGWMEIEE